MVVIGFKLGLYGNYLDAINIKQSSVGPNFSALPKIVSMPLPSGGRSRCWLLKGADDTVHDFSAAAARHICSR